MIRFYNGRVLSFTGGIKISRDEVWTVVSGEGSAILDGVRREVKPGDVLTMEAGCRHTVIAATELRIIEVQLGREINVSDKQKYPMPEV